MLVFSLVLAIIGSVVGSFLGAFTFRYPRGIQIVKGRSLCPNCRAKIAWFDNIPILSYLLLGGRCRRCKRKISSRYLFIEAGTALGFVGIGLLQGFSLETLFLLFVFSLLVAILVIDLEHKIIPDNLIFLLLIITYSLLLTAEPQALLITSTSDFYTRIASGFLAALFLLFVHLITRGRGMGLGDVKFSIFAGTFLGWPKAIIWLFIAFLTGAVVGIILILAGRARFGKPIPFGPFLIISLFLTFIWGEYFVQWLF